MTSRHLLLPVLALGLTLGVTTAQAALVRLSWSTTFSSLGHPQSPPFLSEGEAMTLTLLVDNGGASLTSQTWSTVSFVGIEARSADGDTWGSPSAPDLSTSFGSFQTDASGAVSAVGSWKRLGATVTTSFPYTGAGNWFVNGGNGMLYGGPGGSFDHLWQSADVGTNQTPARWTASFAAVPEPSASLLGLGALAGLVRRRRRP